MEYVMEHRREGTLLASFPFSALNADDLRGLVREAVRHWVIERVKYPRTRWFLTGDWHHGKGFSVSTQNVFRHSPSTVPTCSGRRQPMVFKGKKPILFTNGRSEATYRCDTCNIETKRTVKDP